MVAAFISDDIALGATSLSVVTATGSAHSSAVAIRIVPLATSSLALPP